MVKTKKKQSCAGYTEESLQEALEAVKRGIPVARASRDYGIPKSTLLYKKSGILKPTICRRGPDPILGPDNEKSLVGWINRRVENKLPITKDQLLDSVRIFLNRIGKKTVFKNNRPGRHWYEAFQERHQLSGKITHQTNAKATEIKLKEWFTELRSYLEVRGLVDIDPSRVFNCDEMALILNPKDENTLIHPGDKIIHSFLSGDAKESISTLMCGNANGQLAPPLIMFLCTRLPTNIVKSLPSNWAIGKTDNGWVNGESFYDWIKNVFHQWLVNNNIELPILLYIDGFKSYLTLELSEYCSAIGIIIISLPTNSNNLLQPIDYGIFQGLRSIWFKAVNDWKIENSYLRLKRESFCPLLCSVIEKLDTKELLSNAFRRIGLLPLSFNVDYKDFLNKNTTQDNFIEVSVDPEIVESVSESTEILDVVEENIGSKIIGLFKKVGVENRWNGPVEHESLFYLWQKIKTKGVIDNLTEV